MPLLPSRRWLQFRLSTWFVLVAILGWAMATRPYYGWFVSRQLGTIEQVRAIATEQTGRFSFKSTTMGYDAAGADAWLEQRQQFNPRLKWPALALAVFLAWKAAWAAIACRPPRVTGLQS
jgi:hypothetical protein